jgi:hypothetical protein
MVRPERGAALAGEAGVDCGWLQQLPEAPVFKPTAQEWANPLDYLRKIQGEAARYGICVVRAPVGPTISAGQVRWCGILVVHMLPCHLSQMGNVSLRGSSACPDLGAVHLANKGSSSDPLHHMRHTTKPPFCRPCARTSGSPHASSWSRRCSGTTGTQVRLHGHAQWRW